MFVVPRDNNGAILKPTVISYFDSKAKKPIRKAKINLPPGLIIPKIDHKIERPLFATPIHNPPCIAKILKQRKEQLESEMSNSSSDSE